MTPFIPIAPAGASLAADAAPKPKNAAEAAQQFESLLLAQMLRTAHEESDDSLEGKDASSGTLWDMAAQQFAQMLAQRGGVGLAKLVVPGLKDPSSPAP